jgi:transcriptional regulator with XRE-family HTH domain
MRPGVIEEAQRVIDAMDAVEAMTDPRERAKAIGEVMADQAERGKRWRELRRQVVLDMRAEDPPVSYRKIAAALGVSLATVQDIERGYTGSGKSRPRAKEQPADE